MELHQQRNTTHVYAWGNNQDGQLGIGSQRMYSLFPAPVFGLASESIKMVACGGTFGLVLTEDGHVYHIGKYFYPDPDQPTSEKEEVKQ